MNELKNEFDMVEKFLKKYFGKVIKKWWGFECDKLKIPEKEFNKKLDLFVNSKGVEGF